MLRILLIAALAALVVAAPADLDPNHADEVTDEVAPSKRAVNSMGPSWQQRGSDQFSQNADLYQYRAANPMLYKDQALMMGAADNTMWVPQQRAADQQMYYQPENQAMLFQQRAALEAAKQMYGRQNEEPSPAASSMSPSTQAFARSAYGAAPVHSAVAGGAGGAVGVFPSQLNGGGCGNAIPLLLSCTPNLVQGHVLPLGHGAGVGAGLGGFYAPNLGLSGFHAGIGASPYSSYGTPAYRSTAGSPSDASQMSQSAGEASKPNEVDATKAHSN